MISEPHHKHTPQEGLGCLNEIHSQQVNLSVSLENTRPSWTSGSNSTRRISLLALTKWIYASGKEI